MLARRHQDQTWYFCMPTVSPNLDWRSAGIGSLVDDANKAAPWTPSIRSAARQAPDLKLTERNSKLVVAMNADRITRFQIRAMAIYGLERGISRITNPDVEDRVSEIHFPILDVFELPSRVSDVILALEANLHASHKAAILGCPKPKCSSKKSIYVFDTPTTLLGVKTVMHTFSDPTSGAFRDSTYDKLTAFAD
ncbi:hypothetical protein CC78DRAFT_574830 [Lojkania enalia]|uniref:Uncharacterized protein n=1 Tax=Lojkania enalia TaxID=147567 RepID=A0A9P4NB21_9PLEO|nr:hypothetical protein CC78DRAFT_574830 [Didymosphaeria enalia]